MSPADTSPALVVAGQLDDVTRRLLTIATEGGWRVALMSDTCFPELRDIGVQSHNIDLKNSVEVEATFSAVTSQWGKPADAVVFSMRPQHRRPAVTESLEGWQTTQEDVTRAGFLVAQAGAREMLRLRGGARVGDGSVLFISDATAARGIQGSPQVSLNTAVAGLVGMTKQLAVEWGPYGIRVNMVQTGLTSTSRDESHEVMRRVPLGRVGHPEEIAQTCMFLLRSQASYITGAVLPVDGGFLAT